MHVSLLCIDVGEKRHSCKNWSVSDKSCDFSMQGRELLQPPKATKSFTLASERTLRKWTAEIKFFPCKIANIFGNALKNTVIVQYKKRPMKYIHKSLKYWRARRDSNP